LVIDDEREFREAIAQALGLDGYEVDTARDGSEGATLVCRHPYDLIFCDLRMPEVDGRGLQGDPAALSPRASWLGWSGRRFRGERSPQASSPGRMTVTHTDGQAVARYPGYL
jgi:DNA-binding NarL/FixJ family response regulator